MDIDLDVIVTRKVTDAIQYRSVIRRSPNVNLIEVPFAESVQIARKAIVNYGTAKYVTWFDPDDELYENTLDRMIRALNDHPNAPGVLTAVDRRIPGKPLKIGNVYSFMKTPADGHMMRIFRRDWLMENKNMFDYPICEWTMTAHALVSGAIVLPFSGFCWNVGRGDHTKRTSSDIAIARAAVREIIGHKYNEIIQEIKK